MPPESLSSSYHRYKADTTTFTTWLATTALACGYQAFMPQPSQSAKEQSPTPLEAVQRVPAGDRAERRQAEKAEKKAKKKYAKQSASAPSAPPAQEPVKHHVLTTQELLMQAKTVASSTKFKVPATIAKAIDRAILARKRCSAWFQETGTDNGYSTEGHIHFIGVLEEAINILKPVLARSQNVSSSPLSKDASVDPVKFPDDLSNRFAALEIEEMEDVLDEEDASQVPSHSSTTRGSTSKPSPVKTPDIYELENNESFDRFFRIICFFDDLHVLRKFLHDTWKDYKVGKIDLITAAFITNTAFGLVRREEEEIMQALYPQPTGSEKHSYFALGNPIVQKIKSKTVDTTGFVFFETYQYLKSSYSRDKDKAPKDEEIYLFVLCYEHVYENIDRSTKVLRQDVGVTDVFGQGLRQFHKTREMTSWMVFSTRIMLDIRRLEIDLRAMCQKFLNSLHNSLVGLKTKVVADASNPIGVKFAHEGEKWWVEDTDAWFKAVCTFHWLSSKLEAPSSVSKKPVVRDLVPRILHNPIFYGIKLLELAVDREGAGISLANYHMSIFTMAHLYNAVKLVSPTNSRWPELERVIKVQNRTIFGGPPPTTFFDCVSRIMVKHGVSVNSEIFKSLRKHRSLVFGVANAAAKSYRPGCGYGPELPYDKNTDIFREYFAEEKSLEQTFFRIEKFIEDAAVSDNQKPRTNKLPKKLTPLQFLKRLQDWLPNAINILEIDYLTLTRTINEFLRILVKALNEAFPKVRYTSAKQLNTLEPGHLTMVLEILLDANDVEKENEKMTACALNHSAQLIETGKVLDQFLKDMEMKKADGEIGV